MNPVLSGLAENPALPADLLARLVDRCVDAADEELARELADRADLTREQTRRLASGFRLAAVWLARAGRLGSEDVDPATQPDAALALLDEGAGPDAWALIFVDDPAVERREELAGCPVLPPDVSRRLADDQELRVVAELAVWTASGPVAAELARHSHAEVRRGAAGNEATPPELLAALLTGEGLPAPRACQVCDQEPVPYVHPPDCDRTDCRLWGGDACDGTHQSTLHQIHWQALTNPSTPAWAVARHADRSSALLRERVAAREGLPADTYRALAADPIPMVRTTLAGNPSIDETLMGRLAADDYHSVQRALVGNPRLPLDLLARLAHHTKVGAVAPPRVATAPLTEITELAAATDPVRRMLAALRRDLPDELRDALAGDRDPKVLKAIAPHPGLSEAQLLDMIDRHGPGLTVRAATNPDATAAVLECLTRQPASARKVFREIARHPNASAGALLACLEDATARPVAAAHPALPPGTIVDLLADDDWQVAAAAAANPALPVAVMRARLA
ncbi:hypothetical protein ABH931_002504 [Streptacidiphilus sp. MAP12-33]|uniref:hypothetical protein n=1 Tax=Streptacidiphilus sp. MAP12-33 TaxID=3156266 RepID=UPI0035174EAA